MTTTAEKNASAALTEISRIALRFPAKHIIWHERATAIARLRALIEIYEQSTAGAT